MFIPPQKPQIDIPQYESPLPPPGVSQQDWLKFLDEALRTLVYSSNTDNVNEFVNTLMSYQGQQLPATEMEKITYLLQDATGVNLQAYLGNPAGLVRFYVNRIGQSPDITKYIGIGLIIIAVVLLIVLITR